jgi:hypothetical protein
MREKIDMDQSTMLRLILLIQNHGSAEAIAARFKRPVTELLKNQIAHVHEEIDGKDPRLWQLDGKTLQKIYQVLADSQLSLEQLINMKGKELLTLKGIGPETLTQFRRVFPSPHKDSAEPDLTKVEREARNLLVLLETGQRDNPEWRQKTHTAMKHLRRELTHVLKH